MRTLTLLVDWFIVQRSDSGPEWICETTTWAWYTDPRYSQETADSSPPGAAFHPWSSLVGDAALRFPRRFHLHRPGSLVVRDRAIASYPMSNERRQLTAVV